MVKYGGWIELDLLKKAANSDPRLIPDNKNSMSK
jgi:hypothetical protein